MTIVITCLKNEQGTTTLHIFTSYRKLIDISHECRPNSKTMIHNPFFKVTFDMNIRVLNMYTYAYAYRAARIGQWRQVAVDRIRFHRRINEAKRIISPILLHEHRLKILNLLNK